MSRFYRKEGASGTDDNRPVFQQMMDYVLAPNRGGDIVEAVERHGATEILHGQDGQDVLHVGTHPGRTSRTSSWRTRTMSLRSVGCRIKYSLPFW